jgi:hypothetical protein
MDETPNNMPTDDAGATERRLLAALCQDSLGPLARQAIVQRLERHSFSAPEYEVIFRMVSRVPLKGVKGPRATLLFSLTRLGFPDVDIEPFIADSAPNEEEAAALLQSL